jgi:hypothetical protein
VAPKAAVIARAKAIVVGKAKFSIKAGTKVTGASVTFALHSLTDPRALSDSEPLKLGALDDGILEAQVQTHHSIPIEFTAAQAATASSAAIPEKTCHTSHYTLEYREATGPWDSGLPSARYYWEPKNAALGHGAESQRIPDRKRDPRPSLPGAGGAVIGNGQLRLRLAGRRRPIGHRSRPVAQLRSLRQGRRQRSGHPGAGHVLPR